MKTRYIIANILILLATATLNTAAQTLAGGDITTDSITVRPIGDQMLLSFQLNLEGLEMPTNRQLIYTPILCGERDSCFLTPIIINGRNQQLNYERRKKDAADWVVKRQNGTIQRVVYREMIPYGEWMDQVNLLLAEDLCGCGNLLEQEEHLLVQIDNRPLAEPTLCFITPQAEGVKVRSESGEAYLDFIVNRTDIRPEYRNNAKELFKITATIELVKGDPNTTITGIGIHGYASPEGSWSNNERLARERSNALKEYVRNLYTLSDSLFRVDYTPEDWEGLRKQVVASGLEEKMELLTIIDSHLTPDEKDRAMQRKFPTAYRFMLTSWYPALRHSDYTVNYHVRPFNVEEAKEILKRKPQQLSLEELFMVAQSYDAGSQPFNEVFEIAVRLFPEDATANLNAACITLQRGEWDAAERYLEKSGDTPEAVHARGILAMKKERYEEAHRLLEQAKEGGVQEAASNLLILHQMRNKK